MIADCGMRFLGLAIAERWKVGSGRYGLIVPIRNPNSAIRNSEVEWL